MFHFLARLGRKSWAKQATTAVACAIPTVYLCTHCYGHQIVRNLLIADDGHNNKAEISDKLKSLILDVNREVQGVFNQDLLPEMITRNEKFKKIPTPIKYFASCTLMPVTYGLTLSNQGVLIGLPNYLNFDKLEDLPENTFFVKQVRLFKEKIGGEANKSKESQDKPDPGILSNNEEEVGSVVRLDRNSSEVVNYANTLLLSEKAKKFVIARELFYSDSIRVINQTGVIALSCVLSVVLSRLGVNYLKLADAHVTQRIMVYIAAAFLGQQNYNFVSDTCNREYALEADKKAATLNADYLEGAKEYFEKTIERNKALREIVDGFKAFYDEKGNVKQPFIRFKHIPLDERLKLIRRERIGSEQVFK